MPRLRMALDRRWWVMTPSNENPDALAALYEFIRDVEVALLTTVRDDGSLHARPMMTRLLDQGSDLWFFTTEHAPKTAEIRQDHDVGLSYADPKRNRYASVSGVATVVCDRELQKQLWTPTLGAWFPQRLDDPGLSLLRVRIRSAEYWDSTPGGVVELVAAVQDELGSQNSDATGKHIKIELK